MHLLRCMFFIAAHHNMRIHASHLPGAQNTAGDALSSNRILEFLQGANSPSANCDGQGRARPPWTKLFSDSCRRASPHQRNAPIWPGRGSFCPATTNTSPLPLTEQKLSNFVAFAVNEGLRHQTTCRLSATCKLNGGRRSQGDGYASTGARTGRRPRLPITPVVLEKLRAVWNRDAADHDNGLPAASAFLVSFGRGR